MASVSVLRVATSVSVTVAVIVPDFCKSYPFNSDTEVEEVNVKSEKKSEIFKIRTRPLLDPLLPSW